MKQLLLLLVLLAGASGQQLQALLVSQNIAAAASSNISSTPVQNVNGAHNAVVIAFGSNTGAACLITVEVSNEGTGNAVTAITDTQLNTYVKATAILGANSQGAEIWYAKNCVGGADTVTVALVGACYVSITEWSGASTSAPLDAVVTGTGASVGPLTTALASEMLIVVNVNSASNTVCTGYTQLGVGISNWAYQSMYLAAGVAGSKTASGCVDSGFTVLAMAAFK